MHGFTRETDQFSAIALNWPCGKPLTTVCPGQTRCVMQRPALFFDGPFTRAEYLAAGGGRTALKGARYREVVRSIFIEVDQDDADTRVRVALMIHPVAAFASHWSACRVLRLPVPDNAFEHVTVREPDDRRYRPWLKPHVTKRKRGVIVVRRIPVTDPITTFLQMAGHLSLVDAVVLGDAIVKRYRIAPRRLVEAARASTDYYAAAARRAAAYVRKGVDSPMETRLRMLIVLAGLPEPVVNVVLVHEDGSWRRRFDLCYLKIKLVVEYNGRQHREEPQRSEDRRRVGELEPDGYLVLPFEAEDIYITPLATLEKVRRQLILRGWGHVPPLNDT
jgi:hypothetical protein